MRNIKAYISLLCLTFSLGLNAQSLNLEKVFAVPGSEKITNKVLSIFELEEAFVVWNLAKRGEDGLFIIDKNTKKILLESSLEEISPIKPIAMGVLKDQFVLIGLDPKKTSLFKKDKAYHGNPLFYACFDATGKIVKGGDLFNLPSISDNLRQSAGAFFHPSGNYLVVTSTKKGEKKTLYTSVFDADFNFLGESSETYDDNMAFMSSFIESRSNSELDEEGNLYSLSQDGNSIRIAQRIDNYETIEIALSQNGLAVGESIGNIKLQILNPDSLLVSGLILAKGEADEKPTSRFFNFDFSQLKGHYNMILSTMDREVLSEKITYFTEEEEALIPESFTSIQEDERSLGQYYHRRQEILASGDYLEIVELWTLLGYAFIHDYLIISRYKADGTRVWMQVIDKFQHRQTGEAYSFARDFSGFVSLLGKDQLSLLFNQKEGADRKAKRIRNPFLLRKMNLKKAEQTLVHIDLKTGAVISTKVSDYDENKAGFTKGRYNEDEFQFGPYFLIWDADLDQDVLVRVNK